jgi:hypothetical protein
MSAGPDPDVYVKLASEYSELQPLVAEIRSLSKAEAERADLTAMLADSATDREMREMAEEELKALKSRIEKLEQQIEIMLLPKDAADERSAIIEIRAGTGGLEAALFAGDLFRMYERYAASRLEGRGDFRLRGRGRRLQGNHRHRVRQGRVSRLKFESGVHRVQRVPETEAGGRIHTSAATVAVLPQARMSTSKSATRISASTRCARPAPAASTSTPPIRPCASPISQRHRRHLVGKVAAPEPRPRHGNLARAGSTTPSARRLPTSAPSRAACRSVPATGPNASAPTIFRRAGDRPPNQPDALQARPGDGWARSTRSSTP